MGDAMLVYLICALMTKVAFILPGHCNNSYLAENSYLIRQTKKWEKLPKTKYIEKEKGPKLLRVSGSIVT